MKIKLYISYQDYKSNISLTGFDVDKPAREILKCFLIAMGVHPDTIYLSEGNCSYDLLYEMEGVKYAVEVKDRRFESTKYSDHCIEDIKLGALMARKNKGEFLKIWLCSVFNNGVLAIAKDIDSPLSVKGSLTLPCPKTTTLGDNTLVPKHLLFYELLFKYFFCLAVTDTGEIIPHFDKTAISIALLNANLQYKVDEITEPGKLF